MIRQELIHPMISHFPIALLMLCPFCYIYHLKAKQHYSLYLYRVFLYTGSIFFFMALFTGDEALEIIKPNFCHILDVYAHDNSAHDALIVLIMALVGDLLLYLKALSKYKKFVKGILLITLFVLSGLIVRTSHQGAMLVYEKGAAVTNATCTP